MKTEVSKVLEKCTSYKRGAEVGPISVIQLLATHLCLTLSESVEMARDLSKLLPETLPQTVGVHKMACARLEGSKKKAKDLFKNFVSTLILDKKELGELIKAFDDDIENITNEWK